MINRKQVYDYLYDNLNVFFKRIGLDTEVYNNGLIVAHGDKCEMYKDIWAEHGISMEHGSALYLLTFCHPFSKEVRQTENGWVHPYQWVIDNYNRFKKFLP